MEPTIQDIEAYAKGAGEIIRAGYYTENEVMYKGEIDLVTDVDYQSETYLVNAIKSRFLDHHIVTEEGSGNETKSRYTWQIDPIDGTVNFAHKIPMFSVSVGFLVDGQPVMGVVYDPMRDECFSGVRGKGAWLNGAPIHGANAANLSQCLLATGFPYDIRDTKETNLDWYAKFAMISQGVRRLGSAALDVVYVAAGRFDGYWELSVNPWDIAAGALIAEEASALATNVDGSPLTFEGKISILVANPVVHALMVREFLK